MNDITRAAAEGHLQGWIARDSRLVAASLAPDVTLLHPRLGELGLARIVEHVDRLVEGFPDLAIALEGPIVVEGAFAAYRWVMTGTHRGSFYGRPATGRTVHLPGADFLEVRDALVRRIVEYSDTAGFAAQLAAGL